MLLLWNRIFEENKGGSLFLTHITPKDPEKNIQDNDSNNNNDGDHIKYIKKNTLINKKS